MDTSGSYLDREFGENAGEAIVHEYEVRMLNNELWQLVNTSELSLNTIDQIDALLAMKAQLILEGFSKTFPEVASTLREMLQTLRTAKPTDDTSDILDELHEILRDVSAARSVTPKANLERHKELDRLIELIEYVIATHVTESRIR